MVTARLPETSSSNNQLTERINPTEHRQNRHRRKYLKSHKFNTDLIVVNLICNFIFYLLHNYEDKTSHRI
jgi:hypothetical protein